MTTKAMPNAIASKPMISDEIPAVNSALLAVDSFVLIPRNIRLTFVLIYCNLFIPIA